MIYNQISYLGLAAASGILQLGDGVIGAGLGVRIVLLGGILGRLVGQDFGELGHLDCLVCKGSNFN